jgi:hemerythrin-like metal-binding protein
MAFVSWKDEYGVGVASVDQQHQKLFSLLNALEAHLRGGAPKMDVDRAVAELEKYARFHFADEERVLEVLLTAPSADHQRQHTYFVTEVAKAGLDLGEGKAVDPLELVEFLRDWLVHHILVVDRGAFSEATARLDRL